MLDWVIAFGEECEVLPDREAGGLIHWHVNFRHWKVLISFSGKLMLGWSLDLLITIILGLFPVDFSYFCIIPKCSLACILHPYPLHQLLLLPHQLTLKDGCILSTAVAVHVSSAFRAHKVLLESESFVFDEMRLGLGRHLGVLLMSWALLEG